MTSTNGITPRRTVAVLAFDGVVLGDLSIPCEIFGRVPACEVRVCSERAVVHSAHVSLEVPWRLASLRWAELIIVPGVDSLDRPIPPVVLRALRNAIDRGARVASICTGAFVLAQTGALDGRRATTHWMAAAELARRHPSLTVDPDVLYVDNGQLLTSAGAAAGLDLCLHLVRRDFGAEVAAHIARASVMPLERSGGQAQFIERAAADEVGELSALLGWLEKNLGKDLSLGAMAKKAAMSTRTLSRRFREEVGETPARWLVGARIRQAQRLLETTRWPIERIVDAVGFGSSVAMREQFAKRVGTTPNAWRRTFQSRTKRT